MTRCYVSLQPPPEVIDAVAAVRGTEDGRLRWSDPADYHVTLRFYPDVDRDRLVETLQAFSYPPVDVTGGPAVQEMFDKVVALPISGADELVGAIEAATRSLSPLDHPFRGHLTAGYFRDGAQRRFEPWPVEVAWRAESMIVVESIPIDGRHDHVTLAEVSLGA